MSAVLGGIRALSGVAYHGRGTTTSCTQAVGDKVSSLDEDSHER